MSKNYLFPVLFILGFSSCNPVGKELTVLELANGEIVSAENVSLKKGDVVTIWTKVSTSSKDEGGAFQVKFNIESKGKSLLLDSLNLNAEDHVINSKKTEESYNQSSSTGDSTVHYTVHEYETESKKFTAPADGKYAFDFKLIDRSNNRSLFGGKMAIILRKS
ncbi:hypothetical protein GJU39_08750 [Pedobacter petrophilus]|uniref:Uncharacterized protein n=1 Tax=Pedobacter petrophilus TaxID=1908241 RepID=A0A7K0FZJ7_9SPHI|nr:hypothetical protein [Pedobacter petrophilus]MRX76176.1 hypothetical protein [Pedobacter petrophilus]